MRSRLSQQLLRLSRMPSRATWELVDPVDSGPVSCDVGGQPPVASALAGAEDEAEGGFRPSQEVQEPHGEGLPSLVLPSISGGVVWGESFEGVCVYLGSGSPHGPLGHGGVGGALSDEARQCSPFQVGDEEVEEPAIVREESLGAGDDSWGDGGCGDSSSEVGQHPPTGLGSWPRKPGCIGRGCGR